NISLYVEKTYGKDKQLAEIQDASRIIAVSTRGETLIGYYHLYNGQPAVKGPAPIELLRFYVDQEFHGTGIANQLMEHLLATAAARGFHTLWLGVWENNPRAISFYNKWDFSEVGSHDFWLGNDPQRDLLMTRNI